MRRHTTGSRARTSLIFRGHELAPRLFRSHAKYLTLLLHRYLHTAAVALMVASCRWCRSLKHNGRRIHPAHWAPRGSASASRLSERPCLRERVRIRLTPPGAVPVKKLVERTPSDPCLILSIRECSSETNWTNRGSTSSFQLHICFSGSNGPQPKKAPAYLRGLFFVTSKSTGPKPPLCDGKTPKRVARTSRVLGLVFASS